jgi:opacity protein-like surface antigen
MLGFEGKMMMRTVGLLMILAVGLAACAPAAIGMAVPTAARLSADVLTVTLSDGSVCRADWAASGGNGRMDDCGAGYGYAVTVVEKPNILRQLAVGIVDALGADGALAPLAELVLTDASGRDYSFVSPPPVE